MKTINTLKILTLFSLFQENGYAAVTDWNLLLNDMPQVKLERVTVDSKGYIQMNIAKRPNGKLRFIDFKRYVNSNKIILTIHSKKTSADLESICNDYSVLKKPFRAELSFSVSPISDQFEFKLNDGSIASTTDFENPFVVSEATLKPLTSNDSSPWMLASGDLKKFNYEGVSFGVSNIINKAIRSRNGNSVMVDLSNYNGLACDLAFGYIQPVIKKTIRSERGLPNNKFPWIKKEVFTKLYKSFWLERSKLKTNDESVVVDKTAEMFLLGMKVGEVENIKKIILENPSRPLKLLNAIKFNSSRLLNTDISVIDLEDQWNQTLDYTIPEVVQMNDEYEIASGPAFVSVVE